MSHVQGSLVPRPVVNGNTGRDGGIQLDCKIELPDANGGDEQFGGTRTMESAYSYTQQIGEGTYGQVYEGYEKATQEKVALKKIRMDTEKEGFPITAIREIKILSTLKHENVVRLREIVRSQISKSNNYKGSIYMVFDFADHDLTGLCERQQHKFTVPQIKCLMKQLLTGLHYCHSNGVLHRDLKTSNLLIDCHGVLKLADFGLARPYQDRQDGRLTNRVITLWYRPPELLLGSDKYGPEVDMWSVGCIFAELLTGKHLFPGKDETDQLDRIFSILGQPTEQNWPNVKDLEFYRNVQKKYKADSSLRDWCHKNKAPLQAIDLLEKFLTLDPKKRIVAIDALNEEWFWDDPLPCKPEDLPKAAPSHEWTMKKLRDQERGRREMQQGQGLKREYDGHVQLHDKRPKHSYGNPHGSHGVPPQHRSTSLAVAAAPRSYAQGVSRGEGTAYNRGAPGGYGSQGPRSQPGSYQSTGAGPSGYSAGTSYQHGGYSSQGPYNADRGHGGGYHTAPSGEYPHPHPYGGHKGAGGSQAPGGNFPGPRDTHRPIGSDRGTGGTTGAGHYQQRGSYGGHK